VHHSIRVPHTNTNHSSTLGAVNNLGILCASQNKLEEAGEMYQYALQGFENTLGVEQTATYRPALITLQNLGDLYKRQGNLDQAEQAYSRALDGFQALFGPDHETCQRITWRLLLLRSAESCNGPSIEGLSAGGNMNSAMTD
jgi:tetratricopeptide (TPR) repeat protein